MSTKVDDIYKSGALIIDGKLNDDFIRRIRKDFKDKYRGEDEQSKVDVEFSRTGRLSFYSKNQSKLTEAFTEACNLLDKKQFHYTTRYSIILNIAVENADEEGKDALDIVDGICNVAIRNAQNTFNLSNRFVLVYNDEDYFVDLAVYGFDKIRVIIEKHSDKVEKCNIFETLTTMYYNTIHLSLNI